MIDDETTKNETAIEAALAQDPDGVSNSADRLNEKRNSQLFSYSGASKRRTVIEESNWGAGIEERSATGFEIGAQPGAERDKLREISGKYWAYSGAGADNGEVNYVWKGEDANSSAKVPFSIRTYEPVWTLIPDAVEGGDARNPFFEVKQVIKISADKQSFKNPNTGLYSLSMWKNFIKGVSGDDVVGGNSGLVKPNVEYSYLAFDMDLPYNHSELDDLNLVGPKYAKIRPEYNFYIKGYEEMMRFGAGINQPETVFPNLYALMLEKINETSNSLFNKHLTLNDTISKNDATIGASAQDKFDIKRHSGQYFDLYGRSFANADESTLQGLAMKFKNVVVPLENVNLLKDVSDKKELFPMFVDMEFSTDKMTEFAQALSDTMLTNDFVWAIAKDVINSEGHDTLSFMESEEISSVEVQPDGTKTVTKSTKTNQRERKVWNVYTLLKNSSLIDFDTGAINPQDTDTSFKSATAQLSTAFLDDGTIDDNLKVDASKKFFRSLLGVIFLGKLKTFLKNRTRTYSDILQGHPCHSESVLYRIEKSKVGDGTPVQNFWFPNTNQIDVLRYVDTQIKYKKHYEYRIFAYQLVVDTKYKYDITGREPDAGGGFSFTVVQKPEALLIEQEIFSDSHIIIDDPPVPPEVEIVPYFGDGRKLLFNLKSAVGEYILDPIAINGDDSVGHAEVRKSQKVELDEPIRFKSDDPVGKEGFFEIYRLEAHPTSWTSFDGNRIAQIANNITYGKTMNLSASSAEFVDNISSNKKYYYTCRMTDAHGHVSNPTEIYEVELVNDEGSVYMTKRIVDFAPREPKFPSKSMRRVLHIRPAMEQTWVNQSSLAGADSALEVKNIKLGGAGMETHNMTLTESPWGRKYKFRLVSRKTGKKIDLNVDFVAKMDRGSALK